jgi:hypothetical protein
LASLVGALVYALSGGSSTTPPPSLPAPPPASGSGIAAVAAPTNANQAVAEITSGQRLQRAGTARNPFAPLPGTKTTAAGTPSSHSGASSASSSSHVSATGNAQKTTSGSSGGSSSGSGKTTTGTSTPSPPKPKPVYRVSVLFGVVPEGTPAKDARLTPYAGLTPRRKLPSAKTALLSLREVTSGGKRAVFELLGEAFVKGSGSCVPSASQCLSIALARGHSEELEFLPPAGGHPVVYELQVVSITSSRAAAARARASLLRRMGRLHALLAPVVLAGPGAS